MADLSKFKCEVIVFRAMAPAAAEAWTWKIEFESPDGSIKGVIYDRHRPSKTHDGAHFCGHVTAQDLGFDEQPPAPKEPE